MAFGLLCVGGAELASKPFFVPILSVIFLAPQESPEAGMSIPDGVSGSYVGEYHRVSANQAQDFDL